MLDRKLNGLVVIAAATVVTLVVYGLIRWLWVTPVADTGNGEEVIGWAAVLIVSVVAGLVAWGVAILLKRAGKARWFPSVGSIALALSILGPSRQAEGSSVWALIILHFAVGIVLISGFTRILLPEGWWQREDQSNRRSSLTG